MADRAPQYLTDLARMFRRRPTDTEAALWHQLRNRRLDGLKFRRQRRLGRFIVDFCCDEARLIVEIDGSIHDKPDQRENDAIRDEYLQAMGFKVLRVSAKDVVAKLDDVLRRIRCEILPHPPTPSPMKGEGE